MTAPIALWLQCLIAALMLLSAVFALVAAWGIARLPNTFLRLHPTALVYTGASWSLCLAVILAFSAAGDGLDLRAWIILVLLALTAPITTTLLARAALFRARLLGPNPKIPTPLRPVETTKSNSRALETLPEAPETPTRSPVDDPTAAATRSS